MRVFNKNILMELSKGIVGTLVQAGDNLAVKFFSMVLGTCEKIHLLNHQEPG